MSPIYDFFEGCLDSNPRELAVTSMHAANLATRPSILLYTFQIFKKMSFVNAGIRIYAKLKNLQKI
jgi:hypothetical protein